MDYVVLWIVSSFVMLIYCLMGGFVFCKYRSILDPFIKSHITIYIAVFVAKPFFWMA